MCRRGAFVEVGIGVQSCLLCLYRSPNELDSPLDVGKSRLEMACFILEKCKPALIPPQRLAWEIVAHERDVTSLLPVTGAFEVTRHSS